MTRTVKRNTSDLDAHDSAAALLDAAAGAGVSPLRIKTVSSGLRIDLSAPTAVYAASGLPAGEVVPDAADDPPPPPPVTITATVTAHDPGGGGNVQVTAEISETTPPRAVTLIVGTYTRNMTTGQTLADDIQFESGWTGAMVRLTDDDTAVTSGEVELVMDGADGELAVSIDV